jgi:hypothetical protein
MATRPDNDYPFVRHLPGGGFVAIEVSPAPAWRPARFFGRVIVERRACPRGDRHQPPVIASAAGATVHDVVDQLFPAAQSNAAIAEALLRLKPGNSEARTVFPV